MEKMGYFDDNMDSRVPSASASSASGYSLRSRGSSVKISPFCPRSSSKLTQSIIKDHMISHYKKVYSAKAAIDTSVPKSLLHSVKYNDQLKRGGLKNGVRPQSAHSLSQRSRASCSPAQSHLSLQCGESPYHYSSRSMTSTPRPSTSFHPQNTVYPSFTGDLLRASSERRHGALRTSQLSAFPLRVGEQQPYYKTFQDPVQKTYSGDLLQKHARRFTEDKPFMPKTLKTDKSSFLSKYRYYRSPQTNSQDSKNGEKSHKSTSDRKVSHEAAERSQGFTRDNHTHLKASRAPRLTHNSRDLELSYSFPRAPYEGLKSPLSSSLDVQEEELKYLEFITAVTDDILSRGFISDSVVDRVINRHLDMNRYCLDEGKMRHLLEVLRKDLKEPCNSPVNTLNFERDKSDSPVFLLQRRDFEESKGHIGSTHLESLVGKSNSENFTDPVLTSTLASGSEKTFLVDPIDVNELTETEGTLSPRLSKHNSFSEADIHGNQSDSESKGNVGQSEESNRLEKELQDVGAALESLNVSDHSHCENERRESANAVSEEEF